MKPFAYSYQNCMCVDPQMKLYVGPLLRVTQHKTWGSGSWDDAQVLEGDDNGHPHGGG